MLIKNFTPDIANAGKVRLTFESTDEYYSVFKPLLYLECWAQVIFANVAYHRNLAILFIEDV